ncbi:MAG: rod shape-determining protein MreD [Actinobacteria bacterium]|nr:rod shape-determining protein MreD [Actinomycetota bacterium]
MIALDAVKVAAIVFFASIAQVSIFSSVIVLGGTPDLLLVTLVCVALLRGSIYGATAGFAAGLVVDIATLETLGVTSLLLTLAGYWIGRYGETTGRDRAHAPFLSIAVVTVLFAAGALGLDFLLGESAPARRVLLETLFQGIGLNLIVTVPVYTLCRWALGSEPGRADHPREVRLLG